MRWRAALAACAVVVAASQPGAAQDAQEDRDRGFIVGLIEDNLEAPGLSVRLEGFEGALSSEATLETLVVSDDEGAWLRLEDVVLDWNRSALLRGRLEVEALTAGLIRFERPPLPPEGVDRLPDAGASGFALPDLPVSVEIERLAAQRIELGEAVLGQPVALELEAQASLADGSGDVALTATRLDGPRGRFVLDAAYAAGTQTLSVQLEADEAEGGLAAGLLQLPGAPALSLVVAGEGPLDDFAADIRLASDGVERLGGTVRLDGTEAGRVVDVDLGGDVTALFAPRYRAFFGDDLTVAATVLSRDDGVTEVQAIELQAQALQLTGTAQLGADGWPTFIDVDGRLAAQDGGPVLLPTASDVQVGTADLSIAYDAAQSDDWTLVLSVGDLVHPQARLDRATVRGRGVIARDGGTVQTATARLAGSVEALALADPALADALGDRVALDGSLSWTRADGLAVSGLRVTGPGYAIEGDAEQVATEDETAGLPLDVTLTAAYEDLRRLSGVAGLDGLAGAAEARIEGRVDALAGRYDLDLDATAYDLRTGIDQADGFLPSPTTVTGGVRRDDEGTFLRDLTISNDAVSATATAALLAEDAEARADGEAGRAQLRLRLTDASPLDPRLAGPLTLDADVTEAPDGVWQGQVAARGPQGIALNADGTLTGPSPDVAFDAQVPDLSAFAPDVPGGLTLDGHAFARDGVWSIDARAEGPYDVVAQVEGAVTGDRPEIAFEATLPDVAAAVPALAEVEPLAGPLTLQGTAAQEGDAWQVETEVRAPSGANVRVAGPVTGPAPRIDFSADLPDLAAAVPALEAVPGLDGPVRLTGELAQRDDAFVVDARVAAPSGVTARAEGPVTGDAPRIDFVATVPELRDVLPETVPLATGGTLSLDGTLEQQDGDWTAEVVANGPASLRATADAALTATPLRTDFTLAVPAIGALVEGVPEGLGGLDVSGDVVLAEDGPRVSIAGTGPYAAEIEADVVLPSAGAQIDLTARVPDGARIAPQLAGPLSVEAQATQADGAWRVDADATGAGGLAARVSGVATGPDTDLDVTLRADDVSRLAPGLSGPLDAEGRLFQDGEALAFDVDASGPLNATLSASGTLTGGAPSARFDLDVPNIQPLVPDLSGPLRAQGTATQQGEAWAVDVDLDGPAGTQARVDGTAAADALDLGVTGSAPLGLANAFIAPQRLQGAATFDVSVDGPPALSSVTGTISTRDAALSLPTVQNALTGIDATIRLTGANRAQVDLSAGVDTGGTLSVAGPVDLAAPFDANLRARFDVTLADPTLYTADVSGDVAVTGPLAGGALISGQVVVDGAEIAVPSTGLTAVGDLPPVRHVGTPRPVQRTLARAGQDAAARAEAERSAASGPSYGLDLTVSAPGRIFVRGRGLDAELGGALNLTGTTRNPVTTGGFELVRGRLDILEQRFEFDEGTVSFQGDLIPFIRLVAVTDAGEITASIVVEGPADDIEVRFESSPDLPQEEVLARIFFDRDLSQISPLQALQLANSVAVLSGRSSGGVLDRLRGSAGLDDLDISTDEDGNAAIRAGKYVSDNVYTDVQVNSEGEAEVSINLDVTPNLTVRGSAGAAGETSLGVFFERDY